MFSDFNFLNNSVVQDVNKNFMFKIIIYCCNKLFVLYSQLITFRTEDIVTFASQCVTLKTLIYRTVFIKMSHTLCL